MTHADPPAHEFAETAAVYDTGAADQEPADRLIYSYLAHCSWLEPATPCPHCNGEHRCTRHTGTPVGFQTNATSIAMMERAPVPADVLLARCDAKTVLGALKPPRDPAACRDFVARVELRVIEGWHLTWFSHSRPDYGESDQEVTESFERYVDRVQRFNHRWRDKQGRDFDPIALMGAEDRWRWSAEGQGDRLPCRCDGCLAHNVVRINH